MVALNENIKTVKLLFPLFKRFSTQIEQFLFGLTIWEKITVTTLGFYLKTKR